MELTEREKLLITNGLYILECQCRGDELDHDLVHDLGGTPKPKEVRALMNKVEVNY